MTSTIFQTVFTVLLILIYIVTLVRVLSGSKYKFVTSMVVMLLLSNIGTLANVYGSYCLYSNYE